MLFRPNTTCRLFTQKEGFDIYGTRQWSLPKVTPCAVITFDLATTKSSVRVDSSGTRGRADQLQGIARFLFPHTVALLRGDIVEKDGFWLKLVEIFPRYAVDGRMDHFEVDFTKAEPIVGS